MEGSVLSFLKAEWKESNTGSAHWAPSLFFIQFQICSFCKMCIIMGYKQAIYYFSLEFVKCNFYVQNLDLNELFRVIKDDYLFYFGKVSQIILRLYMYHACIDSHSYIVREI
jgi:hypothetical protein